MKLYELKQFTEFAGGSQGVSLHVMKGVSYRVGAFKGEPVRHEQTVQADTGVVALTQHAVYFGGHRKALRLPYEKLVRVQLVRLLAANEG